MRAQVKVTGISQLQKMLDGDALYAEPWKGMVNDVTQTVARRFGNAAPSRVGNFAGSIKGRMQKRPVPLWSKVTGDFPRDRRFPFMLDAGARQTKSGMSAYHFSRSGASTRGWIRNIMSNTKGLVDRGLERVVREIERRWLERGNREAD